MKLETLSNLGFKMSLHLQSILNKDVKMVLKLDPKTFKQGLSINLDHAWSISCSLFKQTLQQQRSHDRFNSQDLLGCIILILCTFITTLPKVNIRESRGFFIVYVLMLLVGFVICNNMK